MSMVYQQASKLLVFCYIWDGMESQTLSERAQLLGGLPIDHSNHYAIPHGRGPRVAFKKPNHGGTISTPYSMIDGNIHSYGVSNSNCSISHLVAAT